MKGDFDDTIRLQKVGNMDRILLVDDEKDIVRRGRNTQSHHLPKHASVEEYMYSTAFEALIGFLYLTKQNDRLKLILEKCIEYVNNQEI